MKTLGNIISNSFASITLTNGVSFVTITAPPTGIYIISLPPNLGSPGQFLQTNGAGQTSWQTLLPGTGTVSSVNATTPSFLDVTITNPTSNANLAFTLSGTALPTTSGGTGLTAVGTNGQVLTSNGTTLVWTTPVAPGTGTVTSVAASVPSFLTITGSPITSSGTLAITYSGTALPTLNGGTGLTAVGTSGQVLTSNGTTLLWTSPYITSVNAAELTVALGTLSLSTVLATTISDAFATANTALAAAGTAGTAAAAAQTTANSALALATTANGLAVAAGADITTLGNKTISMNVPAFLSVTGSPVTLNSNGGFTVSYSGTALPTTSGGTGLTTVGTNGQVLTSNGTTLVWTTPAAPGTGTVTSVAASVPSFLTITGSPITSSGTLAISYSGTALPTANGGTGSTSASTGTGGVVLATSPTLTTPTVGVASGTSLNLTAASGTPALTFNNVVSARRIVLATGAGNNFQYYGFGIENTGIKYSVNSSTDSHYFYSGTTSSTETEIARFSGAGNLVFPTSVSKRNRIGLNGNEGNHQFTGFGIATGELIYSVTTTSLNHNFYVGTSPTTSALLFRVIGTGGFNSYGSSSIDGALTLTTPLAVASGGLVFV